MNRLLRTLAAVTLLVPLATACEGPTLPTAPGATELVADAAANATTVSQGAGVFTFEGTGMFPCINEVAHNVVAAPYEYHLVQQESGEQVYVELWDHQAIAGTLTGLESGHVWTRVQHVSPMVIRSAGGGMTHYTFSGRFVSETGPTIFVTELFHMSRDANGRLVSEKYEFSCRLR